MGNADKQLLATKQAQPDEVWETLDNVQCAWANLLAPSGNAIQVLSTDQHGTMKLALEGGGGWNI